MYNIYTIGQLIMLADISSRRSSTAIDARPSPPQCNREITFLSN